MAHLQAVVFTQTVTLPLGAWKARGRKRHHLKRMRQFAVLWRGRVVRATARGLTLCFADAADAVSWALDVQHRIASGNVERPTAPQVLHRIGIHMGSATSKEVVHFAVCLQAEAEAGGICVSGELYESARTRMNVRAVPRGSKKFSDAGSLMEIYQLPLYGPKVA
ncbi:MAG: hypothetical protein V1746_00630 [bacterium]